MCFVSILTPVFLIKKKAIDFYSCSYRKLNEDWETEDSVLDKIEAFTGAMGGYPRETQLNYVRSKMLKKIVWEDKPLNIDSKVDLARLPPCRDSLLPHVQRVNHKVSCYKKAHISIFEHPKPYDEDQGWVRREKNIIEPLWTKGNILPQSAIDLLDTDNKDEEDTDDEIELEVPPDYEVDDDDMED